MKVPEHLLAHWSRHVFTRNIKRRQMSISTDKVIHMLNCHAVMCTSGLVNEWGDKPNKSVLKSQTYVCRVAMLSCKAGFKWKKHKRTNCTTNETLCADAMSHSNDIFSIGPCGARTIHANSHHWKLAEQRRRGSEQKNINVLLEGRGNYFRTSSSFAYFRRCPFPMITDDRAYW